jgi:hypothetical protein
MSALGWLCMHTPAAGPAGPTQLPAALLALKAGGPAQ